MTNLTELIYKFSITSVHRLRKMYWKIFKPTTFGVRCIVLNESGNILLVKHFYSEEWYLPGGAMKAKEAPDKAITRELKEECGIKYLASLALLHTYVSNYENKRDTIYLFVAICSDVLVKFNLEIERMNFFEINNLPKGTSLGTKKRINEYRLNEFKSSIW